MANVLSPEKEAEIRAGFAEFPFPAYAGFEIDRLEYGFSRFRLGFRIELTQGMKIIHGGVIAALCDSAVAFALATMFDGGERMLTVGLSINFIAPASGEIFAEARIIHKGRKTAVGEVDVTASDGSLLAKSLVTYHIYGEE